MGFSVDGIFVKGTLLALGGAKALAIKSYNAWGDIRCSIKSTQSLLIEYLLGDFWMQSHQNQNSNVYTIPLEQIESFSANISNLSKASV
jgi:hypothetical protein